MSSTSAVREDARRRQTSVEVRGISWQRFTGTKIVLEVDLLAQRRPSGKAQIENLCATFRVAVHYPVCDHDTEE